LADIQEKSLYPFVIDTSVQQSSCFGVFFSIQTPHGYRTNIKYRYCSLVGVTETVRHVYVICIVLETAEC